jgi:hypothetical protein
MPDDVNDSPRSNAAGEARNVTGPVLNKASA